VVVSPYPLSLFPFTFPVWWSFLSSPLVLKGDQTAQNVNRVYESLVHTIARCMQERISSVISDCRTIDNDEQGRLGKKRSLMLPYLSSGSEESSKKSHSRYPVSRSRLKPRKRPQYDADLLTVLTCSLPMKRSVSFRGSQLPNHDTRLYFVRPYLLWLWWCYMMFKKLRCNICFYLYRAFFAWRSVPL
jgi:hypothetical protein